MKTLLKYLAALLLFGSMTALAIYAKTHGAFQFTDRPPVTGCSIFDATGCRK